MKHPKIRISNIILVLIIFLGINIMLIPFYREQIEISRESTDLANARSAYAGLMEAVKIQDPSFIREDGSYTAMVTKLVQKYDGWTMNTEGVYMGGVPGS